MRTRGKFKGHWYPLPEGYDLKKAKRIKGFKGHTGRNGYVVCGRQIKRYYWHPEKNDLFYEPTTETIFKYMEWQAVAPSGMHSLDGFAKIRKLKGGKSFWVNNISVRECIPIVKVVG